MEHALYSIKALHKEHLLELIDNCINNSGPTCSLNHIDVSDITDMSDLFRCSSFNGDISQWNVSNVTNMLCMFYESKFNGDLSNWNVSHVTNMGYMFQSSAFNGDISQWNVSNVMTMRSMFHNTSFNGDLSNWDVSCVTHMQHMFHMSSFHGNISQWDVTNVISLCDNVIDPLALTLFNTPSVFHWYMSLTYPQVLKPEWLEHMNKFKPLVFGLYPNDDIQTASVFQKLWNDLHPQHSYETDDIATTLFVEPSL